MEEKGTAMCQGCWIGRGEKKVKCADGKYRWRCAKCLGFMKNTNKAAGKSKCSSTTAS